MSNANTVRARVPDITDIKTAVELYYSQITLGNADIEKLFGKHSKRTIAKLKKMAKDEMQQRSIPILNSLRVNTDAAYEAWGLDINDLERRYEKLKKLKRTS